jgi:5-methylcytosine-specific restriction endonuclease McrA
MLEKVKKKAKKLAKKKKKKTARRKKWRSRIKNDGFYYSREWREARYMALVKYGRRCMACGHVGGKIHVDHIRPRSHHPELSLCLTNLQVLCEDCNIGKGAWDETDWRIPEV